LARPDEAAGRHWCFKAVSRAGVDAFWAAGLAHGGVDEGAPGLRPRYHPAYYAAFLRDPDGNRIEAACHRPDG
jgi:catechol 2,3-dioxygenase-like lactoylglutathione lyase family enzyme